MARAVLVGVPHHLTQRGLDRQPVFFSDADREVYLGLVRAAVARFGADLVGYCLRENQGQPAFFLERNCPDAGVQVLAWCLMSNHVHLVVVPERADSLAVLFRRVHGAYAQAVNAEPRGAVVHSVL